MRRGRALDTSAARLAFEPDYVYMVSGFGWWVVSVGVWGGLMRRGRALDTLAARPVFAPDVCDMVLGGGCSGLGVGFSVWGWRVPGPGTSAARHAFAPDYWLWYIWSQLLGFGFGLLEFGVGGLEFWGPEFGVQSPGFRFHQLGSSIKSTLNGAWFDAKHVQYKIH